jgi:hypothetical protein
MYSELYLKQPIKVPTWVFILILSGSFFFLSRIFNHTAVPSRAAKTSLKKLEIVNVSPTRVGVFWQTSTKETGWLMVGENENNLNKTYFDERDLTTKKNKYFYHYVLVKDLLPNKKYYFKIFSENGVISNKGKAFIFKTPAKIQLSAAIKPAYGKVFLPNNLPAENSFLILTYDNNSYPLLTMTKSSGEWLIPLNSIINKVNEQNIVPQINDKVKIAVVGDFNYQSNIEALVANLSPLPQIIILGKDYVFLDQQEILGASSLAATNQPKTIDIFYPKENALLPISSPLIKGIALPNHQVNLELTAAQKKYYFKVQADTDGLWKVATEVQLPPGPAQLTLTTLDEKNQPVTLTRHFTVAKSGEQVLGEATASAVITPTAIISPTLVPTIAPTTAFTPFPSPTIKVAGSNYYHLILASFSLIILGIGVMAIF